MNPKCTDAMKRRALKSAKKFLIALLAGLAGLSLFPYPELNAPSSPVFLDRNGRSLRVVPLADGRQRRCELEDAGWAAQAEVAAEDQRFWYHPGVDPLAIARAVLQNIRGGKIKSGGSTITQQLARGLDPALRAQGPWPGKLRESWDAARLEWRYSKSEILEHYLNHVSFGNRAIGIRAAAELYFARAPADLSLSQSAYLVGLVQAPTALSPFRNPQGALARRNVILARMLAEEMISVDEHRRARDETMTLAPRRVLFEAPHLLAQIQGGMFRSSDSVIRTTIDLTLQREIEGLVRAHLDRLAGKNATQAAALVLDVKSGEVLAWVGSRNFEESEVDGVTALRQPGSALKPFTYALALESGRSPSDLINDAPLTESPDGFSPANFDGTYHGAIRMRQALACSYNIPAARVLRDVVGVERLLEFLRALGMTSLDRDAAHYGIALTLGAGEVRLLDLACAYATLASGGTRVEPRVILDARRRNPARLLSEEAAAILTSILSDDLARAPAFGSGPPLAFPFPVAVKTGTSKDCRDNWTIGYTPRHVVAIWVGNFDGSPMIDLSGATGAAPLFADIMSRVGRDDGEFSIPSSFAKMEICSRTGKLAAPGCPGRVTELFQAHQDPPLCDGDHQHAAPAASVFRRL